MPPRLAPIRSGLLALTVVGALMLPGAPSAAAGAPDSINGLAFALHAGLRMSGTIEDMSGTPLEGITVVACRMQSGGACRAGVSDASGSYMIVGLSAADDYVVAVLIDDPTSDLRGGFVVDGIATGYVNPPPLTLGPGDVTGFRIRVPRATGLYEIRGTVRVATRGQTAVMAGLRAQACTITAPGYCASGTTDADGHYRIAHLPVGSYKVELMPQENSAWLPAYAGPGGTGVDLEGDARVFEVGPSIAPVTDADGVVPLGVTAHGVILDERGKPLSGATVRALPESGSWQTAATTDKRGRYVLTGLRPGSWYDVEYTSPRAGNADGAIGPWGWRPSWAPREAVHITSADAALPPVRVPATTYSIGGSVVAVGGGPVAGATVDACAHPALGPYGGCAHARTGASGTYRVRLLAPGRYRLSVRPADADNLVEGFGAADGSIGVAEDEAGIWAVGTPIVPRVVSRFPGRSATGVAPGATVRIRFSTAVFGVDPNALSLYDATVHRDVPAVLSYDAKTRTATLRPRHPLAAGHLYSVTVRSVWSATYTLSAADYWTFTVRS